MIHLPPAALEAHVAILGKTGSGKTYRAKGYVEDLLREGRRVVILDPTDAWWGLRSNAAGDGPGFPITVFGGSHADVPINEHAGEALGELLGREPINAIISLDGMGRGEMHRFAERFLEALYRVNQQPVYLILDEADEFAPQSGERGTERLLGATDRIVRRGRKKGFRVWMISQRPAVLNKNVLTQANTLIAMRLPASQDRKAIEAWIKGQADEAQAGVLLGSLASLKRGEGWTWCPEANLLHRGISPAITTFDSSRAPDDGPVTERAVLADVDLTGVRAALAEAVERAKENDPAALRAEVKRLKGELATAHAASPTQDQGKVIADLRAEVEFANARTAEHDADHDAAVEEVKSALSGCVVILDDVADRIRRAWNAISAPWDASARGKEPAKLAHPAANCEETGNSGRAAPAQTECMPVGDRPTSAPRTPDRSSIATPPERSPFMTKDDIRASESRVKLSGGARYVADAIREWEALGVKFPTRRQAAVLAGYKPEGSTWRAAIAELRKACLVEDLEGERLRFTPGGRSLFPRLSGGLGLAELHREIRRMLTGPAVKAFDQLVNSHGRAVTRGTLAWACGYAVGGSSMRAVLAELRGLGLIEYEGDKVVPTDVVFPAGGGA